MFGRKDLVRSGFGKCILEGRTLSFDFSTGWLRMSKYEVNNFVPLEVDVV